MDWWCLSVVHIWLTITWLPSGFKFLCPRIEWSGAYCLICFAIQSYSLQRFLVKNLEMSKHYYDTFELHGTKRTYMKCLFLFNKSYDLKVITKVVNLKANIIDKIHFKRRTETFLTSPLNPLNRIQRNLIGSKISTSSPKFVFFGACRKNKMTPPPPPQPLIGWDIFVFSETVERNSTKLKRKQDLKVLYQVCVFWASRKNKMATPTSDWLKHFWLLLWNRWTEIWQEARSQLSLPSVFFGPIGKTRWPPWPNRDT